MFPPLPDLFDLLIWLIPMLFLTITVHEIGHTIAGKCLGLTIACCGIGIRKPIRLGTVTGTRFYIGLPLGFGLAFCATQTMRPDRKAMALFIAGGPLANFLTVALLAGFWVLNIWHPSLAVLGIVSLVLCITNMIPFTIVKEGARLKSDGMQILQFLRGRWMLEGDPGHRMETLKLLKSLSKDLRSLEGQISASLALGLEYVAMGDHKSARDILSDNVFTDSKRNSFGQEMEMLLDISVRAAENPNCIEQQFEPALLKTYDDPDLLHYLLIFKAQALFNSGKMQDAALAAREALLMATSSNYLDLVTIAEILLLVAEPPEEFLSTADALLKRQGAGKPQAIIELFLLVESARILSEREQYQDARKMFAAATESIQRQVDAIKSEQTRKYFLRQVSKSLKQAIHLDRSGSPLFLSPKQKITSPDHNLGRRGLIYTILSFLMLGICVFFPWKDDSGSEKLAMIILGVASAVIAIISVIVCFVGLIQNGKNRKLAFYGLLLNIFLWGSVVRTGRDLIDKYDTPDRLTHLRAGQEAYGRGEYRIAETAFQNALKASQGSDASKDDVLDILIWLAPTYAKMKQYEKAAISYEQILQQDIEQLDSIATDIAGMHYKLGWLYANENKNKDAEKHYLAAQFFYETSDSSDFSRAGECLFHLSAFKAEAGKAEEAFALYERGLILYERALGSDAYQIGMYYRYLADMYNHSKKYNEAEKHYQRAWSILSKHSMADPSFLKTTYGSYRKLLKDSGKAQEVEALENSFHMLERKSRLKEKLKITDSDDRTDVRP